MRRRPHPCRSSFHTTAPGGASGSRSSPGRGLNADFQSSPPSCGRGRRDGSSPRTGTQRGPPASRGGADGRPPLPLGLLGLCTRHEVREIRKGGTTGRTPRPRRARGTCPGRPCARPGHTHHRHRCIRQGRPPRRPPSCPPRRPIMLVPSSMKSSQAVLVERPPAAGCAAAAPPSLLLLAGGGGYPRPASPSSVPPARERPSPGSTPPRTRRPFRLLIPFIHGRSSEISLCMPAPCTSRGLRVVPRVRLNAVPDGLGRTRHRRYQRRRPGEGDLREALRRGVGALAGTNSIQRVLSPSARSVSIGSRDAGSCS